MPSKLDLLVINTQKIFKSNTKIYCTLFYEYSNNIICLTQFTQTGK